jgi:hypothetical protein
VATDQPSHPRIDPHRALRDEHEVHPPVTVRVEGFHRRGNLRHTPFRWPLMLHLIEDEDCAVGVFLPAKRAVSAAIPYLRYPQAVDVREDQPLLRQQFLNDVLNGIQGLSRRQASR